MLCDNEIMIFPYGSRTISILVVGNQNITWVTSTEPKLLLALEIQQSGVASNSLVYCGNDLIAKNYAKDFGQILIYKRCDDIVRIEKTGQDEAYFNLVYYDGTDIPETEILPNPVTLIKNENTGAEFMVDKTLSYGDAILIWFATLFAFYLIFKTAYNFFWKK